MTTEDMSGQLVQTIPLWRQIHDRFALQIESGQLAPGDGLPTTADLAKTFDVTVNTVQQGLDALRRRGLIERMPGRGTFVSAKARARTVGVLFGRTVLSSVDDRFYLLLWGHLGRVARRRGWDLRQYLPVVPDDQDRMVGEVTQDATAGRLRALVYLAEVPAIDRWMRGQTVVPWIGMFPALDYVGLVAGAVGRLVAAGARRIALVPPDRLHHDRCVASLERALASAGLPAAAGLVLADSNHVADGVQLGRDLAAMAEPPDAVVVCNDNACRGLISALLVAGIAIPGRIRVVSHANRGLEVFPGLDVTRYEIDPEAMAEGILDALIERLAGNDPPVSTLVPALVPGITG